MFSILTQTLPDDNTVDEDDPYGSDLPTMVPRPSVVMQISESQLAAVNGVNQESPEEGGYSERQENSDSDGSQSGMTFDLVEDAQTRFINIHYFHTVHKGSL